MGRIKSGTLVRAVTVKNARDVEGTLVSYYKTYSKGGKTVTRATIKVDGKNISVSLPLKSVHPTKSATPEVAEVEGKKRKKYPVVGSFQDKLRAVLKNVAQLPSKVMDGEREYEIMEDNGLVYAFLIDSATNPILESDDGDDAALDSIGHLIKEGLTVARIAMDSAGDTTIFGDDGEVIAEYTTHTDLREDDKIEILFAKHDDNDPGVEPRINVNVSEGTAEFVRHISQTTKEKLC